MQFNGFTKKTGLLTNATVVDDTIRVIELYKKIKDFEREYDDEDSKNKPRIWFITAYEGYRNQFNELFPTLEEVDCFLKEPISLPDLVKAIKSQLDLL